MSDSNRLLEDSAALKNRIIQKTAQLRLHEALLDMPAAQQQRATVVLFLLSMGKGYKGFLEPCLILNKRSAQVRQAGDLCCPGGGISWRMDRRLGYLIGLPGSPLKPRPGFDRELRTPALLNVFLAAGLREGWEEMRLNPLRFSFLGLLPQQSLIMFDKVIHPIVGWANPRRLVPNWEVERIVPIPLRHLLDPRRYGRFRPILNGNGDHAGHRLHDFDFPCFIHNDEYGSEMLWGATYRITQSFLQLVFDFLPPPVNDLPLARRNLDEAYINGSRGNSPAAARTPNAGG
jgi:hypothetical protein